MLAGMRREVWWSRIIRALRQSNPSFPFDAPIVLDTNVNEEPFTADIACTIFEFIDGQPLVNWVPDGSNNTPAGTEYERFARFFSTVTTCLLALHTVHPASLTQLNLPPLPTPSHGIRRWQKKGFDMNTAVLGNGALEVSNVWRAINGRIIIMDNEFAGLVPKVRPARLFVPSPLLQPHASGLGQTIIEYVHEAGHAPSESYSFRLEYKSFCPPRATTCAERLVL